MKFPNPVDAMAVQHRDHARQRAHDPCPHEGAGERDQDVEDVLRVRLR